MKDLFKNISDEYLPVSVQDISLLKEIFNHRARDSWAYFAPFLACYSLPPRRQLFLLKKRDIFCLFQYSTRANTRRIDLVIPPNILNAEVKEYLLQIKEYFRQSIIRILWIDSSDVATLEEIFKENIEIQEKENEYIYDPKDVYALSGRKFRDLRKRINSVSSRNPIFFELQNEDVWAAMDILEKWRNVQGRKNNFLYDWGYTRAALNSIGQFDDDDVKSWGLEIDKKLVGFSMAGPIDRNIACFFVAKTIIGPKGLSEYLRWKTFGELRNYEFVNDAGDLGIPGLRQYKRKFRPFKMNTVYTATI